MKDYPILFQPEMVAAILDGRKTQTRRLVKDADQAIRPHNLACPYGAPGDRLWVRERFAQQKWLLPKYGPHKPIVYMANSGELPDGMVWHPSIHMPKWACRLRLEVTEVRVERVGEITNLDAVAEGVTRPGISPYEQVDAFRKAWNAIHGPGAWARNDWVWCIGFKRAEGGDG